MSGISIIGRYQDTIIWPSIHGGSLKQEVRPWAKNQVQDSALKVIAGSVCRLDEATTPELGYYASLPIRYMKLGSGDASWDSLQDPATAEKDVAATTLLNTTHTIQFTADDLYLLDANGNLTSLPSNRFGGVVTLDTTIVGDLREFGLFGGQAGGNMFNWVSHALIQKDNTTTIQRAFDIQIDIVR